MWMKNGLKNLAALLSYKILSYTFCPTLKVDIQTTSKFTKTVFFYFCQSRASHLFAFQTCIPSRVPSTESRVLNRPFSGRPKILFSLNNLTLPNLTKPRGVPFLNIQMVPFHNLVPFPNLRGVRFSNLKSWHSIFAIWRFGPSPCIQPMPLLPKSKSND